MVTLRVANSCRFTNNHDEAGLEGGPSRQAVLATHHTRERLYHLSEG